MAPRSNSLSAGLLRACAVAACLAAALLLSEFAFGCPFCTPLKPTLAQLRAGAAIVALAEVEAGDTRSTRIKLHRVFDGARSLDGKDELTVALDVAAPAGALLLVFAGGAADAALDTVAWHGVKVDETSSAYFARSPSPDAPPEKRLAYFARFLENADALVAEDAYLEFAHAPFDVVARLAPTLPMDRVGDWLVDENVPGHRKGLYALVLGLARGENQRRANAETLRRLIVAPEDDFRAGFDGILGGYLLLAGEPGLALVESRYLADPAAADGDVRHALAALRFYQEYGREISKKRVSAAARHLLVRPEFAAATIVDLARWKDWDAPDDIAALYARPEYAQPATRRAIVGYLLACPAEKAAESLKRLRRLDPAGVAEAEQILSRTTSVPANE
jgi:hypothetical protein